MKNIKLISNNKKSELFYLLSIVEFFLLRFQSSQLQHDPTCLWLWGRKVHLISGTNLIHYDFFWGGGERDIFSVNSKILNVFYVQELIKIIVVWTFFKYCDMAEKSLRITEIGAEFIIHTRSADLSENLEDKVLQSPAKVSLLELQVLQLWSLCSACWSTVSVVTGM